MDTLSQYILGQSVAWCVLQVLCQCLLRKMVLGLFRVELATFFVSYLRFLFDRVYLNRLFLKLSAIIHSLNDICNHFTLSSYIDYLILRVNYFT